MAIERDKLQHELTIAFDQFMEAFAAIHERSINVKPVPQSWTPIQVALHIIMATDGLPDTTTKVLDREPDYYLAFIRPWWEDLSQKFDSPEYLKSGIEPHTKQQILTELYRIRAKDLAIVNEQDLTTICLDIEMPTLGYLTRYEWLWFIQMHLRRHTHQLQNMMEKLNT
jgi:hypothetical protein